MLDGRFRFDNYVVGAANRLAVAAARAVAESPGTVYNPLFIYSGSGLGKTHLVGALAHAAAALQPELAIEYVSLDDFVDQLHAAISSGQADAFKQRYQRVDLLLIDDVQFLTGRRETQSEMLRIFNALQGNGRQIVMASDRPPSEIADVDERLVTRLSGGLIVDIGMPDYETRVAILRHKCEERGLSFSQGVLEELASLPFANVRELQGALNRLLAHQSVNDAPLDARQVREVVGLRATPPRARAVGHAPPAAASAPVDEFASFLSDVSVAVAQHVEGWRVRLGEVIAEWTAAGVRTALLERVFEGAEAPDVDAIEREFAAAVDRLRHLEAQASVLDPSLAGAELFRDPERLAEAEHAIELAIAAQDPPPAPSPLWVRDTFHLDASNHIAARAADAVVESPGARYNPLFIHGPHGVGKTHLVHAIGNALQAPAGHGWRVACIEGGRFVDEVIAALQSGTVDRWRARYRAADVLIIDDVHAIAGKERSQDELFHLFNAFHGAGKQIVLASDRAPSEMTDLEARLRSRFDGGLVAALQPPERRLRERLCARFLAELDMPCEDGLAAYLSGRPLGGGADARTLVHSLAERAAASGMSLSVAFARHELDGALEAGTPDAVEVAPAAADPFFLDGEKVILDWTGIDGRVIEELR